MLPNESANCFRGLAVFVFSWTSQGRLFRVHSPPEMPTEPITTTGEILATLSERAFKVRLPNGKEVIGHPSRTLAEQGAEFSVGLRVSLEMTPYDFEKARIAAVLAE